MALKSSQQTEDKTKRKSWLMKIPETLKNSRKLVEKSDWTRGTFKRSDRRRLVDIFTHLTCCRHVDASSASLHDYSVILWSDEENMKKEGKLVSRKWARHWPSVKQMSNSTPAWNRGGAIKLCPGKVTSKVVRVVYITQNCVLCTHKWLKTKSQLEKSAWVMRVIICTHSVLSLTHVHIST